ncbi:MAG: sporulation integral membrane protein YtvI [Oscillospiraceae bacterium]|nr:sporulation integral membrane protein YtvI [Oscillospiraceae bacterium]
MTGVERKREIIINFVYYAIIFALFYLFCKYALWLFLPVVIAFITAMLLQRPVNAIAGKTPIKKGLASVICVLLLLLIIVALFVGIGVSAANYLKDFAAYLTNLFEDTESLLLRLENWSINLVRKLPSAISTILAKNIREIFDGISASLSGDTEKAAAEAVGGAASVLNFDFSWIKTPLTSVLSTAKQIPSMITSFLITLISSCFLTADFDTFKTFIKNQLSEKRRKDISRAKSLLRNSFSKMVKAYAMIILITFSEMLIGLTVLKLIGVYKSSYIFIIAALTAVVDILPVLGTGTIIIPWAVYSLFKGEIGMAVGLVVIYIAISVIRQVIEPKLVAGQLGLPPFVTIIGMFVGLKLFGFLGMFIMPIMIIMVKLLNDEGIIHLWKTGKEVRKAEAAEGKPTSAGDAEEKTEAEDAKERE